MKIEKLQIVYIDRNGNHKTVNIHKENMIEEVKNRVRTLHNALKNRIPPNEEESYDCNYCPFNQKCNLKKLIVKNKIISVRSLR
jgi:CRISPR/Cas system-associated exonuclease Cas4 (RecB family)